MTDHVFSQIPDYVLGLLPSIERQALERHTANCPACRQALQRENRVGQLVRSTLQTATQPKIGRLPQLMPTIPAKRPFITTRPLWQLACLASLLILFLGGWGLHAINPQPMWSASPTHVAATATNTQTATATIAQFAPPQEETEVTQTAVPTTFLSPEPVLTPGPVATPVAAVLTLSSN